MSIRESLQAFRRLCAFLAWVTVAYLFLWGIIWFFGAAYRTVNHSGWITHTERTDVFFDHDWMVGEYRTCSMTVQNAWDSNSYIPANARSLQCFDDRRMSCVLTRRITFPSTTTVDQIATIAL